MCAGRARGGTKITCHPKEVGRCTGKHGNCLLEEFLKKVGIPWKPTCHIVRQGKGRTIVAIFTHGVAKGIGK